MPLVIQNNAEGDALEYFVNKLAPQDLVLRLFKNNVTPAETDAAAAYTEADFLGYGSAALAGANWTKTEGAPSDVQYAQQTFTSNAAQATQNVYGYFYTRSVSGRVAGAERFSDAPVPITNNGDNIKITPKITAD
jgi:hypothetical protein